MKEPDAGANPPVDGSELIRFEDVTKRFGSNTVLDQLNFSVDSGKHVTLIGPSGSGKTTILRMLMTLTKPDGGTVSVDGEKLFPAPEKQLREVRKKIGMVFQQFNLFPNMTVLRNITEAPVTVLGMSKDEAEARALELLDLVGLADKAGARPTQLSGGQQQRVAIARALAMRPRVLLLDEVTSALDPELVGEVLQTVRTLKDEGVTMLIATHEMSFAREVADRVVFMDGGVIVEQGPPDDVIGNPTQERTRTFLKRVLDPTHVPTT